MASYAEQTACIDAQGCEKMMCLGPFKKFSMAQTKKWGSRRLAVTNDVGCVAVASPFRAFYASEI